MKIKELLTKEYFKWLFFKASTSGLIILSVYFFIIDKDSNILLGVILFGLSMFTFGGYYRIKPTPPLATCLNKSGLLASMYATTTMSAGLGFILLVSLFGIENFSYGLTVVFGTCGALFASGVAVYIYNCKKNGVIG